MVVVEWRYVEGKGVVLYCLQLSIYLNKYNNSLKLKKKKKEKN